MMEYLWLLFFVGLLVWALWLRRQRPALYCTRCGHVGPPVWRAQGTMALEIVLWLFFIIPGLIYSCWRLISKRRRCGICGSEEIIPLDSPIARAALGGQNTAE